MEGEVNMQICKYCKREMHGEFETLSNNRYRFFYCCHNCGSIYEGIMFEKKKEKKEIESKWFNPTTDKFEQVTTKEC